MNNEEIEKALDKLDKNYFNIIRELDETGKILSWAVYYSNMKEGDYFSDDNTSILSSEKDGVEEILKLVDDFDLIKVRARAILFNESFTQINNFMDFGERVLKHFKVATILLGISTIILLILTKIFLGDNPIISILIISILSISLLLLAYLFENTLDESRKLDEKEDELLVKNELKFRSGNLYEFKKKSRKRSIKKDKTE